MVVMIDRYIGVTTADRCVGVMVDKYMELHYTQNRDTYQPGNSLL
jgi:hypothetical protein